jgi:hypothetical protein
MGLWDWWLVAWVQVLLWLVGGAFAARLVRACLVEGGSLAEVG